jgi:hypothetical protein
MRREATSPCSQTRRLPYVGNAVPRGIRRRNYPRSPRRRSMRTAEELTPAPKNRQLRCSIASRGGTRRASFSTPAAFSSRRCDRLPRAPRGVPASLPTELKDSNDGGVLRRLRDVCRVDTRGVSDRLENWKTCRNSVGLASFVPPEKGPAALNRRSSQRMWEATGARGGESIDERQIDEIER